MVTGSLNFKALTLSLNNTSIHHQRERERKGEKRRGEGVGSAGVGLVHSSCSISGLIRIYEQAGEL